VEYFNPLRNVTVSRNVDANKVVGEAHLLGELVGTALRGVGNCPIELNLLPAEVLKRQEFARRQPLLIVAALSLLVLLAGWWIYYKKSTESVVAINEKVAAETALLQSFDQKFTAADTEVKTFDTAAAPLLKAVSQREAWVRLINDLNQRIPNPKIWVTILEPLQDGKPLVFNDSKGMEVKTAATPAGPPGRPAAVAASTGPEISAISLKGIYLENPSVVDEFLSALAQSPFFVVDLTKIKEINPVRQQPNLETWGYAYELRLPLKQPIPLQ